MENNWKYPKQVKKMKFTEEHQDKVFYGLNNLNKRKNKSRKLLYSSVAAIFIILFSFELFVPYMSNVFANIPLISHFIKEEEQNREEMEKILELVVPIVERNGTDLKDLNIMTETKEVSVKLKGYSGDYEDIAQNIEEHLGNNGFQEYTVKAIRYEKEESQSKISPEESKEWKQNMEDAKKLKNTLKKRLKEKRYELLFPVSVRINDTEGVFVNVTVPESETRIKQLKDILKKEAKSYEDKVKLDVRQVQKIAREQEKRWEKTNAISHIGRALMEAEHLPVIGFAYSFHPYPLQIKIKTSLDANDSDASEIADEIRSEINVFIQSNEKNKSIREDKYRIIVLSKDKNEID
ncbi:MULTISPECIES: DUF4030 domain-containing protein [Pontibacillus]|uniref:DUF4030 domain-containing protein n=1 Tax=Pontibacillus marinus BH030004 = DSM 16465 TaxID=1385511 RepID=A0A0A5HI88_9BACI|nr:MULTISPECIES: DUF4030 domain-containing protein [Pontibacillus]KGX83362.1 hypothetical protein N783_04350 [Pontibacillus marinus BH030004 = DSM 16465]QHE50880.1 DUF4030 domain-containing protein [Pontibacillus sp. HMF3514]QHE52758.1 DUF4030 domain-containing protein [Pontibacillus sp. HMF3514]